MSLRSLCVLNVTPEWIWLDKVYRKSVWSYECFIPSHIFQNLKRPRPFSPQTVGLCSTSQHAAWHRQRLELKIVSSSFQFYQAPLGSLNGFRILLVASQQETMLWIWGFPILTSHIFPGTDSTIRVGWEVPFSSEAQQCQHSLNRVSLWIKTLRWTPKPEPQNAIGCRELLSAWVINDI